MVRTALLAVMLVFVVGISFADAAVLCANPSGTLSVRAASCQPGETKVDPVALGLVGPPGAAGVSGWELVRGEFVDVPPGNIRGALAECSEGKRPLGGGFAVTVSGSWTVLQTEALFEPTVNRSSWVAFIRNDGTSSVRFFASAVCATVN